MKMNFTEEESFPRGGKKPKIKSALKRPKEDDNLFNIGGASKAKKVKKNKKAKEKPISDDSFYSHLNIRGTLSYDKVQEGMVILGCIRHITDFSIEVELPGLTFGYVNITRISDAFTKLLNKKLEANDDESDVVLKKMFHIGQYIPVRILGLEEKEKGIHVECSVNPRDIFEGKSHIWFKKGLLIWASIQSILDHGYEVSVGVKNCRVFLPSKNIDEGREFTIGEPFWCAVHKCESSSAATTLRISSKNEHIKTLKIDEINSLDELMPGMKVDFIIDKVTSNGIQGKFLNDFFGHIDYTQLKNPSDELTKYKEGRLIGAYVLFVEQATKVTHFSMRDLDPVQPPTLNDGEIVKAEVVAKAANGIYLKTQSGEKCFVANKRLIASLPKKPTIDIQDEVKTKFTIGSKHSARILDYNHISRLYVCTVEQGLLKEKNFNVNDLKIGHVLTVKVDSIKTEGIVVSAGRIKGFVPNLYISNVEYSENIKKKFKEGVTLNARVLHVDNGNVIFTLKPAQVESDQCLCTVDQAKRGDKYPGVVVQTKENGALVIFYNNVRGWINKKWIGDGESNQADPREYFFIGQVVHFWILGVKEEKIILSIRPPLEFKPPGNVKLYIGQRVNGIVGAVHKDSIDVKNKKGFMVGRIPTSHLCTSMSLGSTFLKTLKVGDEIENLMCIDNTTNPCRLSRREALMVTRSSKIRIKKFENLKKGNLIRCFYLSKTKTGIYVKPLLVDYGEKILVESKNIVEKGESIPSLKPQQSIVAKIVFINYQSKEIQLTLKLNNVFDSSIENTCDDFSWYLKDLLYLRKFGLENNWELCRYQPGERVNCKVENLGDEGGCLVSLPNGIQGLVPPRLCPDDIQVGQHLTGVFLAENFEENFAEICLRKDIIQRINVLQNGVFKSSNIQSIIAEKLLIKNDYILGVLKPENFNRQFIYIPSHLHENDFSGCTSYYELSRIKVCICGEVDNVLVGMSKKLFMHLDKQNARLKKKKADKKAQKKAPTEEPVEEASKPNKKKKLKDSKKKQIVVTSEEESLEFDTEETESAEEREAGDEEFEGSDVEVEESDVEIEESDVKDEGTDSEDTGIDSDPEDSDGTETELVEVPAKKKNKELSTENSDNIPNPKLSGVSSFFNTEVKEESDSSSDDEETDVVVKRKKKLTPKERAEQIRLEEERISKIEKELADTSKTPETAEQFDRLLLANPNSSELWAKYMSFHLAATEIDKARTVAKRALESINMTLIEEKLNIWIALLNLENMFGTKESFDITFEDALKYNDSLDIYLQTIQMLAESGKFMEMEEKIKKVRNKHKQEQKMWLEVAKTYYMLQRFQEARYLKEACLKSIQNKKTQLEIIIRFAIMEFKYGEEEQGAAIFETVLSNDPKKVTAWTVYVDQLVKKGQIDQARRVLERAVSMHLPLKIMKTLYLKFRMFEEQNGTPESVEAVKHSAKMYFERMSKKLV